ncbi:hypothetical protein, partial [Propionivibrio sp.]|uniref:hypothetical protein n=1 Tax=Propionivibrio sp. TaxID=2212460 RepID=UPI003BF10B39
KVTKVDEPFHASLQEGHVVLLLHQDSDHHRQKTSDQSLVELTVLVSAKPVVQRSLLNFSSFVWPSFTPVS